MAVVSPLSLVAVWWLATHGKGDVAARLVAWLLLAVVAWIVLAVADISLRRQPGFLVRDGVGAGRDGSRELLPVGTVALRSSRPGCA